MSFVRRTAARFSSQTGTAASTVTPRNASDLHPIMEDHGSCGRETDGSPSCGLSTSATFTTDDADQDNSKRPTSQIQLHDLQGVQHR